MDEGEMNVAKRETAYSDERQYEMFKSMVQDSKTPLYPGCKEEHSKLHVVFSLLQLKSTNGWSDKSFTELLQLIGDLLPAVCKTPRYKGGDNDDDANDDSGGPDLKKRKVPVKVAIIPRIERMFANKKHAKMMRWHHEERNKDGMIRHPADGSQWRKIDRKYKKHFAQETRNIRFGLSTDGMNPFGDLSSRHSMWPVALVIYNLPSWLCMKRKYIMMPFLIQGPRQPGNDIDVYFRPLVDDLKFLWNRSAQMWDAYKREYFTFRAMLFVTIQDYPCAGNTSGQTVKGGCACLQCMLETASRWLRYSKKTVYMRHRRFLPAGHHYCSNTRDFDGTVEEGTAPTQREGRDIFNEVKDIECIFGKGPSSTSATSKGGEKPFRKKKSIFWGLPYWKDLDVRHTIDVMHVEKNMCETLMGILLNIPGKTKDTLNARRDLVDMNIRPELHPQERHNGRQYLPPACYTLSAAEKISLLECLQSV
uniref:Transposon protein, putative, CACTA, En/Spm sub-class n=1 Tax=Oryza sativa subsp. japonica TaxID=39947 RepID=Q7XE60_ORYSJ|nr:transposon protein, putative, CACTA, En/Spm sub-class [Oryza sativa Japonica Group]